MLSSPVPLLSLPLPLTHSTPLPSSSPLPSPPPPPPPHSLNPSPLFLYSSLLSPPLFPFSPSLSLSLPPEMSLDESATEMGRKRIDTRQDSKINSQDHTTLSLSTIFTLPFLSPFLFFLLSSPLPALPSPSSSPLPPPPSPLLSLP